LQEAKKEYIMAILFAPSWEPANKKFFLPGARGRILFSMALLSGWILPSSKKGSNRGSRKHQSPVLYPPGDALLSPVD
jgi:hypothetical protein